ncbi:hypothetical protein V5H16_17300 [Vibrio cholerae]|uniref:hypothetical protein n=1 Tax=Vibrio cholerae TaxID=666 RepID=UPI002857D047|nr:hypothetical protein [Vibrio cholerae]EJE4200800.1 hypothetical protein [Vibrio cholerae]EKF9231011.1 hypothetical protein [Vibrio cholerae]ELE5868402.1 hypothetical protein [Vibrio cholerae]ELG7084382.1 hypothetical protein [Vibrio cholerae]
MKIRAANGYYLPSCFFMHISSKEDINEVIHKNEQTFVHEYLHFLQDLIFPYSIRYTLTENRKFMYLNLIAQTQGEITRPFNDWDSDTYMTDKQLSYTWGCNDFIDYAGEIESIIPSFYTIYTNANVYKYDIKLKGGVTYQIGARDFLEYIAHKIESKYWHTNHPEYPYKSVDAVFDYFGFGHISDEVRVCLIEYCMFNDNPMHSLIVLFKEVVGHHPDKFEHYDICKTFLLNLGWTAVGTGNDTIFTKSTRRLTQLRDSLKKKYANEFGSIRDWVDLVVDYSEKNFANRFIFSEFLLMTNEQFFNYINKCIRDIGIPLVFNDNDECISLLSERFEQDEFLQLYVAYNFMNYAMTNQDHCSLYNYCNKNRHSIINSKCLNDPISRANEQSLCPMGQFVQKNDFHLISWNNT